MKTEKDPTGQAKNRRLAFRDLNQRITNAQRRIREIFKAIPRRKDRQQIETNASEVFYTYQADWGQISTQIANVLDEELIAGEGPNWFYYANIEGPFRRGALEVSNNIANDFQGVAQLDPQAVVFSQVYLESLNNQVAGTKTAVRGLSNRIASGVSQTMQSQAQGKIGPQKIWSSVVDRFNKVGRSGAKRIADTSINEAYTTAKIETGENLDRILQEQELIVVHRSALLETTRPHHAARHGKHYTMAQQLAWWNEGANRINCHCDIDIVGKGSKREQRLTEKYTKQRKQYF